MSRVTVNVNGLSLVHEDSGGVSTATLPDVCLTSPGLAPVPFPNVARSRDLTSGSSFVRADGGNRIAIAGSAFGRSKGDEPGSAGGVASHVNGKEATFLSYSFDVSIEGRGACRLGDKMLHNRGNTINCHGVMNPKATASSDAQASSDGANAGSARKKKPLWETPLRPPRRGVDSNCRAESDPTPGVGHLIPSYAKSRGMTFVCRYISGPSEEEALKDKVAITANNIRLSRKEAHLIGMDLVAIWESHGKTTNTGPNIRAVEMGTLDAQHHAGVEDGNEADKRITEAGGKGKPIYFTVDFHVTGKVWRAKNKPGGEVSNGDLIIKYFEGINKAIGVARTGVYGTYTTVKRLFELGLVQYGWQMTFNHKPYPKAQLHQINIFPDITRWGPNPGLTPLQLSALENSAVAKTLTDPNDIAAVANAGGIYAGGMLANWGITGAGGLDFDRAVMVDFGQWRPQK